MQPAVFISADYVPANAHSSLVKLEASIEQLATLLGIQPVIATEDDGSAAIEWTAAVRFKKRPDYTAFRLCSYALASPFTHRQQITWLLIANNELDARGIKGFVMETLAQINC